MARQYWSSAWGPSHTAIGATYNTSTTLTDISPGAATNPIIVPAANFDVGTIVRCEAFGTFATSATTPNLTLGFYWGGTAGVNLASTLFVAPNTATINWPWYMYYTGIVYATGSGASLGSIEGRGWIDVAATLVTLTHLPMPLTAQAAVAIDTTAQKAVTVGATWGTSAAANIAFCRFMSVETLS